MATFIRNRVIQQLSWVSEDDSQRAYRRETLCELDGILGQLEEINLRGGAIPARVFSALRRRGIGVKPMASAPELIESIFAAQELFLRQPKEATTDSLMRELRHRLAS